eukprot:scaffold13372_cov112-Isochrysis_galbana.AAC.3
MSVAPGKPNPFGGAAPRKVDPELEKKLDEMTAITPPPDRAAALPPRTTPKPDPFGGAGPVKTGKAVEEGAEEVTEATARLSVE